MLPNILSKYKLNQICNADEFGLFYRPQRNKFLYLKNKKCFGGKHCKLRLTGLASANAIGEKLPMFVIGKAKSPRYFKNVKHLPCRFLSRKKSWIKLTCPQSGIVRQALEVLRSYMILSDNGECIRKCINQINLWKKNSQKS